MTIDMASMPVLEDNTAGMWEVVVDDMLVPVAEVPMFVVVAVWSALPSVAALLALYA